MVTIFADSGNRNTVPVLKHVWDHKDDKLMMMVRAVLSTVY